MEPSHPPGGEAPARKPAVIDAARARTLLRPFAPYLSFVAVFAFLDAVANLHYPAEDPALAYLIPSLDVVVVLGVYAVLVARGRGVPRAVHGIVAVFFMLARVLRFADGIETRYFNRPFNLYIDSRLLPDLYRLLSTTLSPITFALARFGFVLALGALWIGLRRSLRAAERLLELRHNRWLFAGIVAAFGALSLVSWRPFRPEWYAGAFGASIATRVEQEGDFLLHVYGYRAAKLSEIAAAKRRIAKTPSNLAKLHGANVLVFFIESYGETVLERPLFASKVGPVYADIDRVLGEAGYSIASSILDSPTYGGRSWLAQSTFMTGVRTPDQWHFELLKVERPKSIADFFREAGYRTVLLQPATSYPSPGADIYRFDQSDFGSSFHYAGPSFGWAPMPDQYVLDFLRRTELEHASRRLFAVTALVSSHAPWNDQPVFLSDWSRLGNGAVFASIHAVRYDVDWSTLGKGADGYARSVAYDLDVLKEFFRKFVKDSSLIIVLGDHQPAPDITERSPASGVPVHVLSRDAELVAPFRRRGYVAGMRPDPKGPRTGMEAFLSNLLADFSIAQPSRL